MAAVIREVQARYPRFRVAVEPYESPDDPLIRWWIYILDVPDEERRAVDEFAIRATLRVYSDGNDPFFIGPEDPERTAELLAGKYGPPPKIVPPMAATPKRAGRARTRSRRRVRA